MDIIYNTPTPIYTRSPKLSAKRKVVIYFLLYEIFFWLIANLFIVLFLKFTDPKVKRSYETNFKSKIGINLQHFQIRLSGIF